MHALVVETLSRFITQTSQKKQLPATFRLLSYDSFYVIQRPCYSPLSGLSRVWASQPHHF